MSDFPYLDENQHFQFPPADSATEEGILGFGGNLSPGMLLSAYGQGIFPWYNEDETILWWCPDPRFVLRPGELNVSPRTERYIRRTEWNFTFDHAFETVISRCQHAFREGQAGTWITEDMREGYCRLNMLGYAHSLEVWDAGELIGGLYGQALGKLFFGESMFTLKSNASKMAFIALSRTLFEAGYHFIDCQVYTEHLAKLGAANESRDNFLIDLKKGLECPTERGTWRDRSVNPAKRSTSCCN